jgi:hypothetical protein
MAKTNPNNAPDFTSTDFDAMMDYWRKIRDMTNGTDAMRAARETYLPRFEGETDPQYNLRVGFAVYTDIYGDIVENLADKPFAKEVAIVDGSQHIKDLCEDIDGQGNNLHNFASTYFRNGIDYGIDWIYVDYTRMDPTIKDANGNSRRMSVTEERNSGARPYWIRVPATEMIAVYSATVDGEEEIVHARMIEFYTERNGWSEIDVVQVRELNRDPVYNDLGNVIGYDAAYFRIWQQKDQRVQIGTSGRFRLARNVWTVIDEGPIAIGMIPIVPLIIGERKGTSWQIIPAMKRVAYLQLDYYEEENGLKNIKGLTAYPMLTASGITPEKNADGTVVKAPVGPRAVLYGPATETGPGVWNFIEPQATSLTFLRAELEKKEKNMRELGRQPLTQSSGQLTTSTSDMAALKGMSAVQRWALRLKDALENALLLTAMWLNESVEPTVNVSADFDTGDPQDNGMSDVQAMRDKGDLSRKTLWFEAQRRKVLSEDFDPDEEDKEIEAETPDGPTPEEIAALATTVPSPEDPAATPADAGATP